jgi:hypothetical protein
MNVHKVTFYRTVQRCESLVEVEVHVVNAQSVIQCRELLSASCYARQRCIVNNVPKCEGGGYESFQGKHDSVKQASWRPKQNQNGRYRAGNKAGWTGRRSALAFCTSVHSALSVGLSFYYSRRLPLQQRRNVQFGKHLTLVPFFCGVDLPAIHCFAFWKRWMCCSPSDVDVSITRSAPSLPCQACQDFTDTGVYFAGDPSSASAHEVLKKEITTSLILHPILSHRSIIALSYSSTEYLNAPFS